MDDYFFFAITIGMLLSFIYNMLQSFAMYYNIFLICWHTVYIKYIHKVYIHSLIDLLSIMYTYTYSIYIHTYIH